MKKLLLIIAAIVFVSCSENPVLCPEGQRVKETQNEILLLDYQINGILYQIRDLDPINDSEQITILNHDVFVLRLEVSRLEDFIQAIKESSDCV